MDKNRKVKLGTYSYDELGIGLAFSEFSDEELKKAKEYIDKVHERIKKIFDEEIHRLEYILKDKLRVIPKSQDFAIWYFDNLPIRKQKDYIEITDEEIFKYTKIYLKELEKLLSDNLEKQIDGLKSFNWIAEPQKLEKLYTQLVNKEFVSQNTSSDTFKNIFSNSDLNTITNKVIWLMSSRNRMPNKKSISDLIIVLQENKLIEQVKDNFPKILSNCFKSETTELIFTHSNLSNSKGYSEYRQELEWIVNNL